MYIVYNNDDSVGRLTFSHSKCLQISFLNWFTFLNLRIIPCNFF
jgi:hypothetical protein